jgi:hypothetical protein
LAISDRQLFERRRRRRLWILAGIPVAALLVVLSARVLGVEDACQDPSAAPRAEIALMPDGLSFDQIGTVTRVRRQERQVMVQAVTTKPPDEATVLIQDAATAAGYRPVGADSEGVEAEVFFNAGPYAAGGARVTPAACAGRWNIDLVLLDRDAVPARASRG